MGQSLPDIGEGHPQFHGNWNGLWDLRLPLSETSLRLFALGQGPFPFGFQCGRDEAVVGIHTVVLPFVPRGGVFEPRDFLAEMLQHFAVIPRVLGRDSFQRIDLLGF